MGNDIPGDVKSDAAEHESAAVNETGQTAARRLEIFRHQIGAEWSNGRDHQQKTIGHEQPDIYPANQLEHGVMVHPHD